MTDEYFEQDGDLDIEDVRDDFNYIWSKNLIQVELIRESNPQQGDYFADVENIEIKRKLWINIQGVNSDYYRRMMAGLITPDSTYHCYVKWDEDIENLDIIKIGKYYFRIVDFNKALYEGQYVFQEFNIKRIDKVSE